MGIAHLAFIPRGRTSSSCMPNSPCWGSSDSSAVTKPCHAPLLSFRLALPPRSTSRTRCYSTHCSVWHQHPALTFLPLPRSACHKLTAPAPPFPNPPPLLPRNQPGAAALPRAAPRHRHGAGQEQPQPVPSSRFIPQLHGQFNGFPLKQHSHKSAWGGPGCFIPPAIFHPCWESLRTRNGSSPLSRAQTGRLCCAHS